MRILYHSCSKNGHRINVFFVSEFVFTRSHLVISHRYHLHHALVSAGQSLWEVLHSLEPGAL